MLGHDVQRAGERSGHELVLVDLPEIDITDAAAVDALLDRVGAAARRTGCDRQLRGMDGRRRRRVKARGGARGQRRRSRQPRALGGARRHCAAAHLHRLRLRRRRAARRRGPRASVRRVRHTGPSLGLWLDEARGRAAGARRLAAPSRRAHGRPVRHRRAELRGHDAAPGRRARRRAGGDRSDRLADVVRAPCAGDPRPARARTSAASCT